MSARRLLRESVNSHTLQLIKDGPIDGKDDLPAKIDTETLSWPQLFGLVEAHLRHRYSDYDAALSRGEDRDTLRAGIHAAILRAYPFLRSDPRPLSPEPERKYYDELAAKIDSAKEYEHYLAEILTFESAREGRPFLRERLAEVRSDIARMTERPIKPGLAPEKGRGDRHFPAYPDRRGLRLAGVGPASLRDRVRGV
jgi:hypothetical protein